MPELSEPKILILDDDPGVTELLTDILETEGYRVGAFNSPKDVLYLARQFLPDVMLLDVMMPEIDGYDVCEFFKRDPELRFTRIIILTARDDKESRIRCYRAGADAVIAKPFDLDELREILRTNLASKQAYEQLVGDYRSQSIMDSGSDCYNWKYMESRIVEELKRVERISRPFSLLRVDLDDFNMINMKYGLLFGNEVLKSIAEAINQEIRESDLLGRLQENSFILLLPETPEAGARAASERIQETISSLIFVKKKKFSLHAKAVHCTIDKRSTLNEVIANLEAEMRKLQARKEAK
ncbi:MAG TPA: response regulator [Acidobacteriota bacterium]|nr:response regulator [Acidobacteriota bacterium]